MNLQDQIVTCSHHYQKWKNLALSASNQKEARKCMEKAFFWLELQAAFAVLFAVEQTKGKDPELKKKLLLAKTNLSKRLVDYANEILDELNF
jgi:uncharacterized protein (DUF2461 family)